jgi:hypothetical protein
MGEEQTTNNRVSGRELYKELGEMERRIMAKLEPLAVVVEKAETLEKEVDNLRKRSNFIDGANALIAIIGATIAGWVGTR